MTEVLTFSQPEPDATMAGSDALSLHLEMMLDQWVQARRIQEQEWLEDYQDAMAISRDGDTKGTGAPTSNKSKPLFIGSTRSKIRTSKARIRDALFPGGRLPFDTSPVKEEFREFADTFEAIIDRQLRDDEYPMTLNSGIGAIATYGTGWIMGPFVKQKSIDEIKMVEASPGYRVLQKDEYKYKAPHFEHARTMDVWPDPDAIHEQSGIGFFWVSPKPPSDLETWKDNEEYRYVDAALREYSRYVQDSGSYLAEQARGNVERFTKDGRINVIRFFGMVKHSMLREWETGNAPDTNDKDRNVEIVAIMAGGIVVRAYQSPFKERPGRRCIYEEAVEPEMYGVGIARNNRPHQKVVNAAFRLYMEGKGFSLLGMFSIDRSKFSPLENFKMYPGKVFERATGVTAEEAKQALIQIKFDDVTQGWENVIALSEKFSDDDTGISKYTQGQDSSNLNKTATGVSMIMNASSVPLKDVISNVDQMWVEKNISDLIAWDLEFLEPETVAKLLGDEHAQRWAQIKELGSSKFMTWKPTGQSTFIAKEVLTGKLQQYMGLVMSNEAAMQKIDLRELLEQVWDAMDVGKESPVLSDEDLQKQGQGQLPPEIQQQMMAAKEEFDALVQEHQGMQQENQKIQQDNQSLQMQIKDKTMSLMEEQRQFNEKMQFEQQKMLLELQGKNTESERAAIISQYQANLADETKRFNVQLAEETKRVIAESKMIATAANGSSFLTEEADELNRQLAEQKEIEELAKQQQTEQTAMVETEQRRVSSEKMDALVESIQNLADKMETGKSSGHRKLKMRKLPDGSMDVDVIDE